LKLEKALQTWPIHVQDVVALDVGASTGGFTHCLLLNGASRVYAIDVGYGQLDYRLRQDARVVSKERVNARHLTVEHVPEPVDLFVMDVSFISMALVLPAVVPLLRSTACGVVLVKPQFEAGRAQVGKGGVVRDPAVHRDVLLRSMQQSEACGLTVQGVLESPVRGPSGNVEFLLWLERAGTPTPNLTGMVEAAVQAGQALPPAGA
jgi:23S rRNA (cytidine1920-2'-O)/16S rRNA (cytidine1409-2'-O)-methyltransferase